MSNSTAAPTRCVRMRTKSRLDLTIDDELEQQVPLPPPVIPREFYYELFFKQSCIFDQLNFAQMYETSKPNPDKKLLKTIIRNKKSAQFQLDTATKNLKQLGCVPKMILPKTINK